MITEYIAVGFTSGAGSTHIDYFSFMQDSFPSVHSHFGIQQMPLKITVGLHTFPSKFFFMSLVSLLTVSVGLFGSLVAAVQETKF